MVKETDFSTNKEQEKKLIPEKKLGAEVRELPPQEFWSGSILVKNISDEEFEEKIKQISNESKFSYSGYRVRKDNKKFKYHFGRYPRIPFEGFEIPTVENYRDALKKLSASLNTTGQEEALSKDAKFRLLLGLEEGYGDYRKKEIINKIINNEFKDVENAKNLIKEKMGELIIEFDFNLDDYSNLEQLQQALAKQNFSKTHTQQEVREELGKEFDLTTAEIYSIWPDCKTPYTESAIVIEGNPSQLGTVYALAEKFRQARISVDDLHKGISYMVETKYCENPDPVSQLEEKDEDYSVCLKAVKDLRLNITPEQAESAARYGAGYGAEGKGIKTAVSQAKYAEKCNQFDENRENNLSKAQNIAKKFGGEVQEYGRKISVVLKGEKDWINAYQKALEIDKELITKLPSRQKHNGKFTNAVLEWDVVSYESKGFMGHPKSESWIQIYTREEPENKPIDKYIIWQVSVEDEEKIDETGNVDKIKEKINSGAEWLTILEKAQEFKMQLEAIKEEEKQKEKEIKEKTFNLFKRIIEDKPLPEFSRDKKKENWLGFTVFMKGEGEKVVVWNNLRINLALEPKIWELYSDNIKTEDMLNFINEVQKHYNEEVGQPENIVKEGETKKEAYDRLDNSWQPETKNFPKILGVEEWEHEIGYGADEYNGRPWLTTDELLKITGKKIWDNYDDKDDSEGYSKYKTHELVFTDGKNEEVVGEIKFYFLKKYNEWRPNVRVEWFRDKDLGIDPRTAKLEWRVVGE